MNTYKEFLKKSKFKKINFKKVSFFIVSFLFLVFFVLFIIFVIENNNLIVKQEKLNLNINNKTNEIKDIKDKNIEKIKENKILEKILNGEYDENNFDDILNYIKKNKEVIFSDKNLLSQDVDHKRYFYGSLQIVKKTNENRIRVYKKRLNRSYYLIKNNYKYEDFNLVFK